LKKWTSRTSTSKSWIQGVEKQRRRCGVAFVFYTLPPGACTLFLAWGPVHGASAEYVNMQMVNGLSAVVACVEHQAKAIREFALGERSSFLQQMAKDFSRSFGYIGEVLFWDKQPVRGSLRVNVGERERLLVFVDGFHRDLVACDSAEETI
jgi:hypothetical protein